MNDREQICAILYCDVVKSSNIPDGPVKRELSDIINTLMKEAATPKFGAFYIGDRGDGFLALVGSATKGAELALHIRDVFRNNNWRGVGSEKPIGIRVGLDMGLANITEDESGKARVHGSAVDKGARIEPAATPNSVFGTVLFMQHFDTEGASHIHGNSVGVVELPKDAGSEELFELFREHEVAVTLTTTPKPKQQTRSVRRPATDEEVMGFVKSAFAETEKIFRSKLSELEASDPDHVQTEFEQYPNARFTAKVFVNGNLLSQCKIWMSLERRHGNSIKYYSGHDVNIYDDSTLNEQVYAEDDGRRLFFKGLGMPMIGDNCQDMDEGEAAAYLWKIFERSVLGY